MASTEASSSPGLASPSSFFLRPAAAPAATSAFSPSFQKPSARSKSAQFDIPEQSRRTSPQKAAEKKPRKKLAKSASTILNSDDLASTQFAGIDAADIQSNKFAGTETLRKEEARRPKATKPARKHKKSDNKPAKVPQESAYFAKTDTVERDDSAAVLINLDSPEAQKAQPNTPRPSTSPVQAHRRRLSWTPAKNTTVEKDPTTDREPLGIQAPALKLATVLSSLSYANSRSTGAAPREPSGEALIKRRRIESADETTVPPKPKARRKAAEPTAPTVEKLIKPRAPKKKKKAHTITELATKAYRPDEAPINDQATVSSFFAPADTDITHDIQSATSGETTAKPKNPRKPRPKKSDGDATSSKPLKSAKASRTGNAVKKAVKKTVRIKEADDLPPLYEPERARAEERRQGFLFGTSSQLGVEDSPTLIRQIQFAVSESEALASLSVSCLGKSCGRVPTAPHVTSLSVGQAGRGLWCSAARDHTGEVHNEPRTKFRDSPVPTGVPDLQASRSSPANSNELPQEATMHAETSKHIQRPPPEGGQTIIERLKLLQPDSVDQPVRKVVDLCDTSPILPAFEAAAPRPIVKKKSPSPSKLSLTTASARIIPESPNSDDEWMLLKSDDSSPKIPPAAHEFCPAPVMRSLPSLKRFATSPMRRSALQTLDANISAAPLTAPHKEMVLSQHRAFAISGPTTSPQKRSGGQPRKDRSVPIAAITSAPQKTTPRKKQCKDKPSISPSDADLSKIRRSASHPVSSSSGYVNIDEISDSESSNTPSPRRRRATSSPPAIRALDLEVTASPSAKAKTKGKRKEKAPDVAIADLKVKPDDANWVVAMPELYKQIMYTIKSTPSSNDMANPTWHEKILLYDPIVLEDLTKWLNEQGVRIQVQQAKAVPKVKRKKTIQDTSVEAEDGPAAVEYETVKLQLVPWMVQKWCQEKSVCCLWKEGLRGGVKTRY